MADHHVNSDYDYNTTNDGASPKIEPLHCHPAGCLPNVYGGDATSLQADFREAQAAPRIEKADDRRAQPLELSSNSSLQATDVDPPNFHLFRLLLGCLALTSVLAVCSALDAKHQCISRELYYLTDLVDDDAAIVSEMLILAGQINCVNMFRYIILPVGLVALVFIALAVLLINRHLHTIYHLDEQLRPSHLSALLRLILLLAIILAGWTYGIFSIMLRPKQQSAESGQKNPYNSLAAVDQMGHVGDNANLYYLSWMSEVLIITLVYQVVVDCFRWCSLGFRGQRSCANGIEDVTSVHDHIQTMLSYTSARKLESYYKKRRKTWYQFMLRLRLRSGFWVAALISSSVVLASSAYLFAEVLVSLAYQMSGGQSFKYHEICHVIQGTEKIPPEFCMRTSFAVLTGGIATCFCVAAVVLHLLVRRKAAASVDQHCGALTLNLLPGTISAHYSNFPLWMEFLLSLCLSLLLGLNAAFATGVQGPASTVGNLYYASWISFLLCLRICLGCLEEIYYIETHRDSQDVAVISVVSQHGVASRASSRGESSNGDSSVGEAQKERPNRLRKYFFLSIFSLAYAASAWDAARNQGWGLTHAQRFMILAPSIVAGLSVILFLLCLKPKSLYLWISPEGKELYTRGIAILP